MYGQGIKPDQILWSHSSIRLQCAPTDAYLAHACISIQVASRSISINISICLLHFMGTQLHRSETITKRIRVAMDFIKRLLGLSKISFYHSADSIELLTKDGNKTTLLKICEAATPPCRLNPFLFNGHLQTFWTVVKSKEIPVYYKRKVFEADDPAFVGSFAVDFVVKPYEESDASLPPRTTYYEDAEFENIGSLDDKPMLVALHGLSGGSHEIYLRSVLWPMIQDEWEVCVVNSRGCALSAITSGVLYNARSTWDIRQVIKWLAKIFPNRPLFGLGFSLGANILVNVRTADMIDLQHEREPNDIPFFNSILERKVPAVS